MSISALLDARLSSPRAGDGSPAPRSSPFGSAAAPGDGEGTPVVLIAEDHADSRDALRTLLDACGYRVLEAADGEEALAQADAGRPDLILMDMMMPRVDGFEATRALRAREDFARVPIIAVTALEGARDRVLGAGCDDLVTKPINVRTFLQRVQGWLEAGRSAG